MRWIILTVCFANWLHADAPIEMKADTFDAVIAPDGCVTNLKVIGREFLAPGINISRGSYFYQGEVLKLDKIERRSDRVVVASSDRAEARYEFGQDSMTWKVSNKTDKPMSFFLVMDPLVKVAFDESGAAVRLPSEQKMPTATFVRSKSALQISGATKQWGPWERRHPVWEATLAAGEARVIDFKARAITPEEQAKIDVLNTPPPEAPLTVLAPMDYQVFQRQTRLVGKVRFSGRVKEKCDKVEVRLEGTKDTPLPVDWIDANYDAGARSFFVELPTRAGGWYRARIRSTLAGTEVASVTIEHVGVGEVFVGAGQSNSTNSGGEGGLTTETKMVSTFGGTAWRLADDPQPGVHDNSMGGSFWPAFGDALYEKYKVPIGLAVTGHGGTSINQWQKGDELFQWTLGRIGQLGPGGFRAVLWHQGESDTAMTSKEYQNGLTTIIRDMKAAAGWEFPWIAARVSYHNPDSPKFDSVRDAQKAMWDDGTALEGPDTDTLAGDNRDGGGKGIHFSPKGLRAHGKMWAEKVEAYLDRVLGS